MNIDSTAGFFFVLRLGHLQHIYQSFKGRIVNDSSSVDITRFLVDELHPTPVVYGFPAKENFFDRGMYAGPFGFWVSTRLILSLPLDWDFLLRLPMRSLEFTMRSQQMSMREWGCSWSTVQGEWSETGYNLELCQLNLRSHRSL